MNSDLLIDDYIENRLFGTFPPEPGRAHFLGSYELDFCPHCKRDMLPGEPPFHMKKDNHVERCIYGSKLPDKHRRRP